ncbi:DUF262 domain-containing protein [Bacteroides faecalis]|uniref:GmrSD restriction endonucleases N-terminal domain-containing protein n=1 Tax=Bacteroides faecalis TaxID=2447885 RepID=A0A401LWF9_9BACE|nr:DUF262 domain-containing protein [Bacteroides faecalis]GCB35851.1 hypothetical protein KGMB02408_27960 [Bacteroides faecalis]
MEKAIILRPKLVSEIEGTFFVPSYQRGYRWSKNEVSQLLDDIEEYLEKKQGAEDYYLQPIVVKDKGNNTYELIDGQQRLTTLKLIYLALYEAYPAVFEKSKFRIAYETRVATELFLEDPLNASGIKMNVDFAYIKNAFINIKQWFATEKHSKVSWLMKFYPFLEDHLRIIWYEVPQDYNSISLFTRLNIGRIPLTDAELVRALVFRGKTDNKKIEWAYRWSVIEEKLQNDKFWFFLTNKAPVLYPNRIELLFDLISRKEKEVYPAKNFTFNYYYNRIAKDNISQDELWQELWDTYNLLYEWYSDKLLYHRIGYLIATNESLVDIKDLYFNSGQDSKPCNKKDFSSLLDKMIKERLNISSNALDQLSYLKSKERNKIFNILLLFNVISTMNLENETQLFPFAKHKGKSWSLEHIHAQQDAGLKTESDWNQWANMYKEALRTIIDNPTSFFMQDEEGQEDKKQEVKRLFNTLEEKIQKRLNRDDYNDLAVSMEQFFKEFEEDDDLHSISNLALLGIRDNSTFNNAPFSVKRKRMLELDRDGSYIPICTRRIFLKYYTDDAVAQFLRWTAKDRESYLENIKNTITDYLNPENNNNGI